MYLSRCLSAGTEQELCEGRMCSGHSAPRGHPQPYTLLIFLITCSHLELLCFSVHISLCAAPQVHAQLFVPLLSCPQTSIPAFCPYLRYAASGCACSMSWSGKLILERINAFLLFFFPSHHKYVSASGSYMYHFPNRWGTGCAGAHLPSMQNGSCTQPSAGIVLTTNVTYSVILTQINSQKINKAILL